LIAQSLSVKPALRVPANDFGRQWQELRGALTAVFEDIGASGWYVLGREVAAFEEALARRWGAGCAVCAGCEIGTGCEVGIGYAVGVGSGLDALEISLRLLGCKRGDKVLTTPVSAFATTLAILKLGAVPVFVDCEPSGLISLDACEELLERAPDIRYFVPVHLYGNSLDLERLDYLRNQFQLRMVEDCAQSIGARWRSRSSPTPIATGTIGQAAATSFYPTKNLGAFGDGGAILTSDPELAQRARHLRDYGQSSKYCHEFMGYNSRLDELQAALLGRVFLPQLGDWIEKRRGIANTYLAALRHPGIVPIGAGASTSYTGSESSWHLFPVAVAPDRKAAFLQYLKENGITPGEHYPIAIPDQPAMADAPHENHGCPEARRLCASEVSLPIHPYLTVEEVQHVIATCNQWRG
jgi:dTDP-3-amino-3,4,6-trideoxy-alpha-D-glucose transaminase